MDFEHTLTLLKQGARASRKGWNGKGLYVELLRPDKHDHTLLPHFVMNSLGLQNDNIYAQHGIVPWLPSQTDLLAEDWTVV